MPLSGSCFWAIILPVERSNLLANPSFERGTAGWGTLQAGTIGTTSQFQQFGAWSGSIAPTSNGTAGAIAPTFTAGAGTDYTFSAYVRGQNGIPYRLAIGDSNGQNFVGSMTFTGGGTWHRYVGSWTEGVGATRRAVLTKAGDADTSAIYIDGVQIEVGSLTTYFDGDQDGCYWLGIPHNSSSYRSGTYRGGGTIVALADLGLKPDDTLGAGAPPFNTTSQSFALDPGSEFLDQRAAERTFTLTCKLLSGTTQADYHRVRRTLQLALKADAVSPKSPVRLWYTGGQGTVQIDAVLAGGFEGGERDGPMAENVAVRFIAHDPYWYATTQQGTAISGRVNLGSTNFLVKRDVLGRWGTLGANGSNTDSGVLAMAYLNGTVYLGGGFGSTAGTRSGALSFYNEQTNTFGTFGGTVQTSGINALTVDADGTIIFGGAFTNISGLSNTRFIARYANGFATIQGGTVNNTVNDFAWQGGTLCVGGVFTAVAGTNTGGLAFWSRSGYGSTDNGTVNGNVLSVAVGLDKRIYTGLSANGAIAAGTTVQWIAQYNGAWGSMGTGVGPAAVGGIQTIAVGPNGIIYVGGGFTLAGGGSALDVAQWSGQAWSAMGSGISSPGPGQIVVYRLLADQQTGNVYGVGIGAPNASFTFPDNMGVWNGYRWLPLDIDLASSPTIQSIFLTPGRTLYVGGNFTGTADAAGVAQVVNTGMAPAYPIIKARNNSGAAIQLYQVINTLTGAALYFDLRLEIGEEVTYVSEPGNRSFTSSFRGNIFSSIVPGSNPSDFNLLSGTNYLSFFASSGSIAASVFWTPRSDSFDAGTAS